MPLAAMFDPDQESNENLQIQRGLVGPNSPEGTALAPYEHQAFAREFTQDHPIMGPLALSAAVPVYQVAKFPGIINLSQHFGLVGPNATPPSLDQLIHGYRGIGQGIYNNLNSLFSK